MGEELVQVGIYYQSQLVEIVEAAPAIAWRCAVSAVRSLGWTSMGLPSDGWYQTANNVGYARGKYRCVAMQAFRGSAVAS